MERSNPSTQPLAAHGPPHGIDLFSYAAVSADLAEGDRAVADVLRERALTDAQWTEVSLFWARRMGEDARDGGGACRVAIAFSDAFARAQDQKRPLPPLEVEEWAALVHEIEVTGATGPALIARGLSQADHARLVRHWARTIATQRDVADRYTAARRDDARARAGAPADVTTHADAPRRSVRV